MNISTLRLNETLQSKPTLARWSKRAAVILMIPCCLFAFSMISNSSARADEYEPQAEDEQLVDSDRFNDAARLDDEESEYREFGADVFVSREDDRRGPPHHRGPGHRFGSERGGREFAGRGRGGERGHADRHDRDHDPRHARKGPPNRSKALAKHHGRGPHFGPQGGKPGDRYAHKGPPQRGHRSFSHGSSRGFGGFAHGGGRGGFGPHSFGQHGGKGGSFARGGRGSEGRGHSTRGHRGPPQLAHHRGPQGRGSHFSGLQSRGHFAMRGPIGGFGGQHGFGGRGGFGGRESFGPRGGFGRGDRAPSAIARGGSQGNQQLIRLIAQLSKEVKELRAEVKSLKGEHGRGRDDRRGPGPGGPRGDRDGRGGRDGDDRKGPPHDSKDGKKDAKQVRDGRDEDGPRGPRFMHAEFGGQGFGGQGFGGPGGRPGFRPSQDRDDDGPRGEREFRRGPGPRFEEDDNSDI